MVEPCAVHRLALVLIVVTAVTTLANAAIVAPATIPIPTSVTVVV